MSSANGALRFIAGALVGAAAGVAAGVLIAPRPGYETRDMVARSAGDVWDDVVDTYQKGAQEVVEKAGAAATDMGARSDELREKVDQARARMDQIRADLAASASQAAAQAAAGTDATAGTDAAAPTVVPVTSA